MKNKQTANSGRSPTGELFRTLRCNAGLSQEEAAEKLSCSARTIQRYEAGETTPDYFTLRRMPDCFNCEAADLFPYLPPFGEESGGDGNA